MGLVLEQEKTIKDMAKEITFIVLLAGATVSTAVGVSKVEKMIDQGMTPEQIGKALDNEPAFEKYSTLLGSMPALMYEQIKYKSSH